MTETSGTCQWATAAMLACCNSGTGSGEVFKSMTQQLHRLIYLTQLVRKILSSIQIISLNQSGQEMDASVMIIIHVSYDFLVVLHTRYEATTMIMSNSSPARIYSPRDNNHT